MARIKQRLVDVDLAKLACRFGEHKRRSNKNIRLRSSKRMQTWIRRRLANADPANLMRSDESSGLKSSRPLWQGSGRAHGRGSNGARA